MNPTKNSPSYSLSARSPEMTKFSSPAPGNYEVCSLDKYKDKSPNYSLSMRTLPLADRSSKPGPGAYMSEKVKKCNKMLPLMLLPPSNVYSYRSTLKEHNLSTALESNIQNTRHLLQLMRGFLQDLCLTNFFSHSVIISLQKYLF